jgi:hypothetical protein
MHDAVVECDENTTNMDLSFSAIKVLLKNYYHYPSRIFERLCGLAS